MFQTKFDFLSNDRMRGAFILGGLFLAACFWIYTTVINPTERWLISPTSERPEFVEQVDIIDFDPGKDVSRDYRVELAVNIRPEDHMLVIAVGSSNWSNALLGGLTKQDAYQNCHGLGVQVRHLYVLTDPSDPPGSNLARGALLLGKKQNKAFVAGQLSKHNSEIGYDTAYGNIAVSGRVSTGDSRAEAEANRMLKKFGYQKADNFLYHSIRRRSEG